jgi:hypothetical protein
MESRFEALWKMRTPLDTELDDLTKEGRLCYDERLREDRDGKVIMQAKDLVNWRTYPIACIMFQPLPSKQARYANPLPAPEPSLWFDRGQEVSLTSCQTVGDVYANLAALALPSRTLSMLQNRATFLLLFANRNPGEVQARFSVTLYHTLYNEFFGCGDGNLDRQSYLLRRVYLLQEYLQQGIPVVGRFFAEYLIEWDGKELFLDVINLLPYIQITDFTSKYKVRHF